jgi:dolichol-phosphate mannosyltransferase
MIEIIGVLGKNIENKNCNMLNNRLVIVPTYNEKENIQSMIEAVMGLPLGFDMLVVDDGSPDGTAAIVKSNMVVHDGRLFIEERKGKSGLGTAYIHGFKWALSNGYDFVFEMDCDFSHNPKDLIRLYEALNSGGADVSVGSRYVSGGAINNWPWDRKLLSYGASLYVRFITGMPIKDTTAGFVGYTRAALLGLDLDAIRFVGYAFQIEMKYTAWRKGCKIVEVPITFIDRVLGASKMSGKIIKEAVWGVLSMRFQAMASLRDERK